MKYSIWKVKCGTLRPFYAVSRIGARAHVNGYLEAFTRCERYIGMSSGVLNGARYYNFFDVRNRTLARIIEIPHG